MITDFILNVVFGGISALLSLVPSVTIPSVGSDTNYYSSLYNMNRVIPIEWAVLCFLAYFGTKVALQVWDFIVFVYHQFWGSD